MKTMCAIADCRKHADKRLGKRCFCSDHYKEVKRQNHPNGSKRRATKILSCKPEVVFPNLPLQTYRDYYQNIH